MIPKSEIETFRIPSEYVQWFESHLETIGRDCASREEALQHKGFWKQFYEEFFPLYSLLKHKQIKWNQSRFRNILGNQSYDVEIENNKLKYLEIGTTEFDDGELLRMREFIKNGHVNLLGKPKRDERNRPIAIEDEARSHNEIVRDTIDSISTLIISKSNKRYPNATGLIAYYDDFSIMFNTSDNISLRSCVERLKPKWKCTFDVIHLVGPRGDKLVEVNR